MLSMQSLRRQWSKVKAAALSMSVRKTLTHRTRKFLAPLWKIANTSRKAAAEPTSGHGKNKIKPTGLESIICPMGRFPSLKSRT
ncbi:hypothetical protein SAMN05444006_10542 [Allgaiera indica]|uniref:Uncharacterized protein n=1 Tax=Allgaiera indica TaxID=765699 RepID=A0A1H2USY8_9RHOB|nr:hypothetical protein SAMN05444006_10542 [Allgaiera indica]